jgi:hypothetical protein
LDILSHSCPTNPRNEEQSDKKCKHAHTGSLGFCERRITLFFTAAHIGLLTMTGIKVLKNTVTTLKLLSHQPDDHIHTDWTTN